MKRREFIKNAGSVGFATAAATAFPKPALSQNTKQLKMTTTWPKNSPGLGASAQRLADRVNAMSGGTLTITVYGENELTPAFESFDAVSNGKADMYHGVENYWQNKSKAFNFFASVPFGMTASEHNAWIRFGGGQALWDEVAGNFGVKPFMAGNTGMQMGGWFNKEVFTADDFNGLKMRMPGLGADVLTRLNAFPLMIPGSEIFPAMHAGAIDATEWFGPWLDLEFGLQKIAKYYYYPGFHEPGTTLSCGINIKIWQSLSRDHQAIIEAALAAENDTVLAEFTAKNIAALDELVKRHGVSIRRYSSDLLNTIGTACGEVVAELSATDGLTGKVYKSFLKYRKQSIAWTKLTDQTYTNARSLPFKYSG